MNIDGTDFLIYGNNLYVFVSDVTKMPSWPEKWERHNINYNFVQEIPVPSWAQEEYKLCGHYMRNYESQTETV